MSDDWFPNSSGTSCRCSHSSCLLASVSWLLLLNTTCSTSLSQTHLLLALWDRATQLVHICKKIFNRLTHDCVDTFCLIVWSNIIFSCWCIRSTKVAVGLFLMDSTYLVVRFVFFNHSKRVANSIKATAGSCECTYLSITILFTYRIISLSPCETKVSWFVHSTGISCRLQCCSLVHVTVANVSVSDDGDRGRLSYLDWTLFFSGGLVCWNQPCSFTWLIHLWVLALHQRNSIDWIYI